MKKIVFSLVALLLLIQIPVFATETQQEAMFTPSTNQPAGMPEETPGMSNQPAGAPMSGVRNPALGNQMVSTSDGGVILYTGWRLMKYDANLNLVKDVLMSPPKVLSRKQQLTPVAAEAEKPATAGLQEKVI